MSDDVISLLNRNCESTNLLFCRSRALSIRLRTTSLASPAASSLSFSTATGGTSTCKSIRSRSGPDNLFLYFTTTPGRHLHCLVGCPKNPQGQGFDAARSKNLAG